MQVVARRLIFPWSGFQRPSGRMVDCDMMRHPDPSLFVRGHEKVRTFGHEKSAPVAMRSPHFWPSDVLTPR